MSTFVSNTFVSIWKYFRDELRFPLIQDVGPLAQLAQGGANLLDEVRELVYWLRRQMNPETCEDAYVNNHARSRAIQRGPQESWQSYRARVTYAVAFHWLAGKHNGIPQILELMGYPGAELINWRENNPEKWAEIWCELLPDSGLENFDPSYEELVWLLNEYKPARSKLRGVGLTLSVSGSPVVMAAGCVGALCAEASQVTLFVGDALASVNRGAGCMAGADYTAAMLLDFEQAAYGVAQPSAGCVAGVAATATGETA